MIMIIIYLIQDFPRFNCYIYVYVYDCGYFIIIINFVRGDGGERTVKKVKLSKALTIPDGTTVTDACRRMAARRVDAVLLTDSSALLSGILTDKVSFYIYLPYIIHSTSMFCLFFILLIVIFRMLLLELSQRGYYRMSPPCPKL
jgi:hypothetical protein